jgi:transcriptional regulator with XRE-family HTH domain
MSADQPLLVRTPEPANAPLIPVKPPPDLATARIFRTCSCGAAFADANELGNHLDESGDDSGHVEIALDLNALVRFGIRRIRIQRGLSMQAMAELLGLHVSAISRIESGKRHAIGWGRTPRTVAILLGVEVSELLRVCGRCGYRPPEGYQCHWCGMSEERLGPLTEESADHTPRRSGPAYKRARTRSADA